MERRPYVYWASLAVVLCFVVASLLTPASAWAGDNTPKVLPPHANPFGASYGEWGGRWWTWALSAPPAVNPVLDTTGEFCAQGQAGKVWFLAGAFLANPPTYVTRNCTIPVGKALFFPVLNTIWFTYAADPANCAAAGYSSLEECALDYVGQGLDGGLMGAYAQGGLQVTVDGAPVNLAFSDATTSPYRAASPAFNVPLPLDNVGGITTAECPLVNNTYDCNPYYTDGIWVMLAPLSRGNHTVQFSVPGLLYITYNLTIKEGKGVKADSEDGDYRLFAPFIATQP